MTITIKEKEHIMKLVDKHALASRSEELRIMAAPMTRGAILAFLATLMLMTGCVATPRQKCMTQADIHFQLVSDKCPVEDDECFDREYDVYGNHLDECLEIPAQ